MADDDLTQRWIIASRDLRRILSGKPPATMADQLSLLSGTAVDLDQRPDIYGGGLVAELETRVAGLLGKPAAAFFPTGTMAQQVALRIWSEKTANPTVALHPLHHPEVHERKAYSTLSGLRAVWPTTARRSATADEIRAMPEPFSVLSVELPLRDAGFILPTWDELVDGCAAVRERGAAVHFDGARLWESTVHFGQDLPTIAALADSVYVSFYKSLGALAGAVLAGDEEFVQVAKVWRHRYGGQMFSQWPTILTALDGLDRELPRLPDYVAHARLVADALAGLPGATVVPHPPHTHQFQLWLPFPAETLNRVVVEMAEQEHVVFAAGWHEQPPGGVSISEITVAEPALAWTADDVLAVGKDFVARASA
ncbi:MAG TPA: beta-eliminating lyase-related protein [Micromonosporaceae bacterium]|jgi:threonine aldolase